LWNEVDRLKKEEAKQEMSDSDVIQKINSRMDYILLVNKRLDNMIKEIQLDKEKYTRRKR
jgi:hypothetical protein